MTTNQPGNSGSGGATSNSVPQLEPVFSYRVRGEDADEEGGDIFVYVAQSEIAKFALISYDDTSSEAFYAVQTYNIPARSVARDLVLRAVREWSDDDGDEDDPFYALLHDAQAMEELERAIVNAFRGEDA